MKEENEAKNWRSSKFNGIFYIASFFLVLSYVVHWFDWLFSSYFLLLAGSFYILFSILRLKFHKNPSLFQTYSYVFFLLVIPGFILDDLEMRGAPFFLYPAASIPVVYFIHEAINKLKSQSK